MPYYVYILQSQVDDSFYIGSTIDVERRLDRHNHGFTRYTSRKRPWTLVHVEVFDTKRDALIRELYLKRQRNRAFYQRLISGSEKS